MSQISLNIPQIGQPDTTEDVKIQNNFTTLQNVINGNLDSTNLSAAAAQSAIINQGGQTVKGAVNIATAQSTSSTTYATLSTPDQVSGLTLASNGLIAVWYRATWQESQAQTVQAAFFMNSNQVQIPAAAGPVQQATSIGSGGPNVATPLFSTYQGLVSLNALGGYTGDVTTGQIIGGSGGGPCWITAAAGSYTVSVRFRITGGGGGSTTVSNRTLWAAAFSFA